MLCDKYKEALIEAAMNGAALPNALRRHIELCAACRATLASQQALCRTISSSLSDRVNAELSSFFLPRLRARVAEEPNIRRRWFPVWAGVAACTILSITALLVWNPWHTSTGVQAVPAILASNSVPDSPEKQWRPDSATFSRTSHIGKGHTVRTARRDIRDDEVALLVPSNQKAIVDQLIGHIQSGEIDGKVLIPNSNEDLTIAAIEIAPITTPLSLN